MLPSPLSWIIAVFLLTIPTRIAIAAENEMPSGSDYGDETDTWNGLGKVLDEAKKQNVKIIRATHINWEDLDPISTSLLFLSPRTSLDHRKLSAFLHLGGKALVAEDHRNGSAVFDQLGIPLIAESDDFPEAVLVAPEEGDLLGLNKIQTNHPSSFDVSHTPILGFPYSGRALFISFEVGNGKLFLLSDPSIFINDMMERLDNKRLIFFILNELKKPGRTILLLDQFTEYGWPQGKKPTEQTPFSLIGFIEEVISELVTIFGKNGLGLRLLGLLLLTPFIYAMLDFVGTQTLVRENAPPFYSSVNSHRKELIRLQSLKDLLFEKLSEKSGIREDTDKNFTLIVKNIRRFYGENTAAELINILSRIAKFSATGWRIIDISSMKDLSDSIEDLIWLMENESFQE
jgi:hypothetical protein